MRIAFGAPCPVEIWEEFEQRFGVELVEVYGMTEAPMGCENRLDNRKIGSAGRESMTYEMRIVDENDEPVPPDTPGEIVLRPKESGALFTEYYNGPRTRSRRGATSGSTPATGAGWTRTGSCSSSTG